MAVAAELTRVLLVADPGLPVDVARDIAESLPWEVSVSERRLPVDDDGTLLPDDIDRGDADVVVLLTDQPRADHADPIVAELRCADGVGMVSLPALGALRLHDRATAAVDRVVRELAGAPDARRLGPFSRRGTGGVCFVAEGWRGRLRVLAGMVRANRPWRLLPHLSNAFAAALAVLAYGLLNPTIVRTVERLLARFGTDGRQSHVRRTTSAVRHVSWGCCGVDARERRLSATFSLVTAL